MNTARYPSLFLQGPRAYPVDMDLTLHQLRLFLAVVDHGTISGAATAIGYTPSAVSQQLSGLEQACGTAVFERVGRGVRLSDAGRALVDHARGMLDAAEAALAAVARVDNVVEGGIDLAAYESVTSTLIPPLLRTARSTFPDLEIGVRQMDPDDSLPALLRGEVDLAFTVDYPHASIAHVDGLRYWDVTHDRFHLVVPADEPVGEGPVPLAAMADRPFVASPPGMTCGECVIAACRAAGFEPQINHALHDYPTSLQLVAAGEGVALVPDLGLLRPPPGVRIVPLASEVTRTVQLAVRAASETRPAFVAVRDMLVAAAADLSLVTAPRAA